MIEVAMVSVLSWQVACDRIRAEGLVRDSQSAAVILHRASGQSEYFWCNARVGPPHSSDVVEVTVEETGGW